MTESKVALPRLPPETWIEIFSFATAVPDDMLHPALAYSRYGPSLPRPAADRYRASLAEKMKLVTVCRLWHALALPLCFEHVAISQEHQLDALLEILGVPSAIASAYTSEEGTGRTLGHLVKRLDLLIPGLVWYDAEKTWYEAKPVVLCKKTPNVKTLIFKSDYPLPAVPDYFPIGEVFPPDIEYLWSQNAFDLRPTTWLRLLESYPRLAYIGPPCVGGQSDSSETDPECSLWQATLTSFQSAAISFPALRELLCEVDVECLRWLPNFPPSAFPNLSKVTFGSILVPDVMDHFLASFGHNLTSIHIAIARLEPGHPSISLVCNSCPRLSDLFLSSCQFNPNEVGAQGGEVSPLSRKPLLEHHSITTFGLCIHRPPYNVLPTIEEWAKFCATLTLVATRFPNLHTVQLLHEEDLDHLRQDTHRDILNQLLLGFKLHSVEVVDHFGTVVDM